MLADMRHINVFIKSYSPMLPSPATMLGRCKMDISKLPHINAFHNLIHLLMSIFDMMVYDLIRWGSSAIVTIVVRWSQLERREEWAELDK